jgi:cell pole-organizing protein PopZ
MEEILASIRRIIADDDPAKAAAKATEAASANPPPAPKPVPPPVAASPRPAPPPPPSRPATPPPPLASKPADAGSVFVPNEPKPAAKPAAPPAADVLDLTEQMAAPTFRTIDAASDVVFAERTLEAPSEPARPSLPPPAVPDYGLISGSTRAAVDNAFNSLAHTVLGNNARTLEDLVKEMLRPMLKSWLDDNLPGLVERIVRAEIERVSRGR